MCSYLYLCLYFINATSCLQLLLLSMFTVRFPPDPIFSVHYICTQISPHGFPFPILFGCLFFSIKFRLRLCTICHSFSISLSSSSFLISVISDHHQTFQKTLFHVSLLFVLLRLCLPSDIAGPTWPRSSVCVSSVCVFTTTRDWQI